MHVPMLCMCLYRCFVLQNFRIALGFRITYPPHRHSYALFAVYQFSSSGKSAWFTSGLLGFFRLMENDPYPTFHIPTSTKKYFQYAENMFPLFVAILKLVLMLRLCLCYAYAMLVLTLCLCYACAYVMLVLMLRLCLCYACAYVTLVLMLCLCLCYACAYVMLVLMLRLCLCYACAYVMLTRRENQP